MSRAFRRLLRGVRPEAERGPRILRLEAHESVELTVLEVDLRGYLLGEVIATGERIAVRLPRASAPSVRRAVSPGDRARLTFTESRSRVGMLTPQVRAERLS